MLKFFSIPFAQSGDRAPIPNTVDVNGFVSYPEGYGFDYQRQKDDPASKNIERDKMNQAFFDMTGEIGLLQQHGVPDFITSALNGGAAFEYSVGALVRYDAGSGAMVYVSLVDNNDQLPSVVTHWRLARFGTPATNAGGTANALTATFVPALGVMADGELFVLKHAVANTGPATLNVNGGGAFPIVKANGVALGANDIPGADSWGLYVWNATLNTYTLVTAVSAPDATTSVKGIARLSTDAEAAAGSLTNAVVTPAGLTASALGRGQTLQNVTGSRAVATTYTNTTGRPIWVLIYITSATASVSASVSLNAGTNQVFLVSALPSGAAQAVGSFIVPPGFTYGISTGGTIAAWNELR